MGRRLAFTSAAQLPEVQHREARQADPAHRRSARMACMERWPDSSAAPWPASMQGLAPNDPWPDVPRGPRSPERRGRPSRRPRVASWAPRSTGASSPRRTSPGSGSGCPSSSPRSTGSWPGPGSGSRPAASAPSWSCSWSTGRGSPGPSPPRCSSASTSPRVSPELARFEIELCTRPDAPGRAGPSRRSRARWSRSARSSTRPPRSWAPARWR